MEILKVDISDDCILGLDFNANFKLDIRLSDYHCWLCDSDSDFVT